MKSKMTGNKTVIITGAGGTGCGRTIAKKFASEGLQVVVADINKQGGHETVEQIKKIGGTASFFQTDISNENDIKNLIDFTVKTFGHLDVLINNAQTFKPGLLNDWLEQIQTDFLGTMFCIKYAIDEMLKSDGGAIVNMSSVSALKYISSNSVAYDASNSAILRMTTGLVKLKELHNIRVNALASDWIGTEEILKYIEALTPEQRVDRKVPAKPNKPEDIANAVYQFATDEKLFGRIMVCWCGKPHKLIATDDFAYSKLDNSWQTK
ncbi:MAG TPA: SDR family NAD(P)-dependent oxidoreductase [Puia sp.]|nr:SDR family NAD(P)-dependent oxidoreductase [Puia sp.]